MTRNLTVPRRELPPATMTAVVLSLAAHIGVMLWFGPVSIRAPQPPAFEMIDVTLVSEPAPRISPKLIMRPHVSQSTVATPTPETPTQESADVDQTPTPPPQGSEEPLVESNYRVNSLNNPKPPYPLAARRRGEQGRVILHTHVRADGVASEVEIKQSSGYELLDNSARQTVQQWRFVPASRRGVPIDSWVEIPITFRLEG